MKIKSDLLSRTRHYRHIPEPAHSSLWQPRGLANVHISSTQRRESSTRSCAALPCHCGPWKWWDCTGQAWSVQGLGMRCGEKEEDRREAFWSEGGNVGRCGAGSEFRSWTYDGFQPLLGNLSQISAACIVPLFDSSDPSSPIRSIMSSIMRSCEWWSDRVGV